MTVDEIRAALAAQVAEQIAALAQFDADMDRTRLALEKLAQDKLVVMAEHSQSSAALIALRQPQPGDVVIHVPAIPVAA